MTNEEAIHDLRGFEEYFIRTMGAKPVCLEFAVKAIEKQIPKKRVPIDNFRFYCPSCKKMQIEDEEGWTIYYEFCPYCGQAISL